LGRTYLCASKGKTSPGIENYSAHVVIPKGTKYKKSTFEEIDPLFINDQVDWTKDAEVNKTVQLLFINYRDLRRGLDTDLKRRKYQIQVGDELPPGIIQKLKFM